MRTIIPLFVSSLLFGLFLGCAGEDDEQQTEMRLCARLAECNALNAGLSVQDCGDIVTDCTGQLLTSAHADWTAQADDCLAFNNCGNFAACWLDLAICGGGDGGGDDGGGDDGGGSNGGSEPNPTGGGSDPGPPADTGDEPCPYTNDGACDEPNLCPPGTDAADCAACPYTNDGACDEPNLCPPGTDAADCGCNDPGESCDQASDCCGFFDDSATCVDFGDEVKCAAICDSNSDCNSGCCTPLTDGGGVCAPASYCG